MHANRSLRELESASVITSISSGPSSIAASSIIGIESKKHYAYIDRQDSYDGQRYGNAGKFYARSSAAAPDDFHSHDPLI